MNGKFIESTIKISLSTITLILSIILKNETMKGILLIISYFIVGNEILIKSFKNITKKDFFDENLLMTIATLSAFFLGDYSEAVVIVLLFQIGELFQDYAVNKSKKSISKLSEIRADYANLLINNNIKIINPQELEIDDIIIIKPYEKVPIDGIIIEGNSSIDTKNITGESLPALVNVGDKIISGCINMSSTIKVKVEKKFQNSTVCQILKLVQTNIDNKAKVEKFITKFASIYTKIVVISAILITFVPFLFLGNFNYWLYKAITFLVISCPCALVISTPLCFFKSIGSASKKSILIKGGNCIESISNINTIIFDKTGTLTYGKFEISKIHSINLNKEELLKYAAYAEYGSKHPIAESIKKEYGKDIEYNKIKTTKDLKNCGVTANVYNKNVVVCNYTIAKQLNLGIEEIKENGVICYIIIDDIYSGYIILKDKIKENAKVVIKNLKKLNKRIIMLTGDKNNIAENTAKELEINEFYSDLTPEGKLSFLKELLKNENNKVLFVGDGVNDAPIMTFSNISITMGNICSDIILDIADIVIMSDNLIGVLNTIKIAIKTMNIIKLNIILAIFTKIFVLFLGLFIQIPAWLAIFSDIGITIITVMNSILLL